jgi:hypothetical protein
MLMLMQAHGGIDFIVQEQGRDQFGQNFLIPLTLHGSSFGI